MDEQDFETSMKIIVVGNGQVGKTSMITRYARGIATEQYKKTIGTDFMEKSMILKSTGDNMRLMLWDTAGQEMFAQLTRQYYRGAGGVIFVFSTVDRDSFNEIERWAQKVKDECGDISAVLVQNKIDLIDQAVMTNAEVEDLAQRMGLKLYRCCVKDNIMVNEVFEYLAESFVRRGGEASLGVQAVADIAEVGKKPEDAEVVAQNNVEKPFTLTAGPSKQRTGGKKKPFCSIL